MIQITDLRVGNVAEIGTGLIALCIKEDEFIRLANNDDSGDMKIIDGQMYWVTQSKTFLMPDGTERSLTSGCCNLLNYQPQIERYLFDNGIVHAVIGGNVICNHRSSQGSTLTDILVSCKKCQGILGK